MKYYSDIIPQFDAPFLIFRLKKTAFIEKKYQKKVGYKMIVNTHENVITECFVEDARQKSV